MLPLSLPNDIRGARFDSIGDFARYLRGPAAACPYMTKTDDNKWSGGTPVETQARLDAGSAKATAACDRLLGQMESVGFATSRFATVAAVAGGAPCVPAYLAGNPLAMRRRVKISDDAAPLAVVVDIGVSASVKAATIERRGAAALALVRLLAATRPVTLWAVSGQNISRYSDHATDAAFWQAPTLSDALPLLPAKRLAAILRKPISIGCLTAMSGTLRCCGPACLP